jgi:hypothetical protein
MPNIFLEHLNKHVTLLWVMELQPMLNISNIMDVVILASRAVPNALKIFLMQIFV